ncbi:MAG TPA: class II fumarate hydratase [Candidatus Nitrosocosmicus sp.]|nr:class II fumarate hydratase [Candidatus Nitrosocosmicus sp.]
MSKGENSKSDLKMMDKTFKLLETIVKDNTILQDRKVPLELNIKDLHIILSKLQNQLQHETKKYRLEKDSLGEIKVPDNKLWGAQTQRSLNHFSIGDNKMPVEIMHSLALIKKCAAKINSSYSAHKNSKKLSKQKAGAIIKAANDILNGNLDEHFPLYVWQTGSGTQSNMNINEVITNHALHYSKVTLHPNDDVNMSQSSNDVFSTVMHIAAAIEIKGSSLISLRFPITQSCILDEDKLKHIRLPLLQSIQNLRNSLKKKSKKYNRVVKVGRTHLQDAIPITFGQEISGWVAQLDICIIAIENALEGLYDLAIGGTAVGTGFGSFEKFGERMSIEIAKETSLPFRSASNKFALLASHDSIVLMSGALKNLACTLMKIANDIRWLASGPRCGIGEIRIPQKEPGSSIMPGKINPTQCEALTMICCQVIGNDMTIGMAGSQGNFELNVFKPVLIFNLLDSIHLLSDGCQTFCDFCVNDIEYQKSNNSTHSPDGIAPNIQRMNDLVSNSLMLVTQLKPRIGYDKAAEIANVANKEGTGLKEAAIRSGYISEKDYDSIVNSGNMVFSRKN